MRRYSLILTLVALLIADLAVRLGGPEASAGPIEAAPRRHLRCHHFPVDLNQDGGEFETSDSDSDIGLWVSKNEAVGWRVASADLEIGQKATGLMQAWTQICLERSL